MGMLLRHRRELDNLTTTESLSGAPEKPAKPVIQDPVVEPVENDEKPKVVKRGRPTTKK